VFGLLNLASVQIECCWISKLFPLKYQNVFSSLISFLKLMNCLYFRFLDMINLCASLQEAVTHVQLPIRSSIFPLWLKITTAAVELISRVVPHKPELLDSCRQVCRFVTSSSYGMERSGANSVPRTAATASIPKTYFSAFSRRLTMSGLAEILIWPLPLRPLHNLQWPTLDGWRKCAGSTCWLFLLTTALHESLANCYFKCWYIDSDVKVTKS